MKIFNIPGEIDINRIRRIASAVKIATDEGEEIIMQAMGSNAIANAIKVVALANQYAKEDNSNWKIFVEPKYQNVSTENGELTMMQFISHIILL